MGNTFSFCRWLALIAATCLYVRTASAQATTQATTGAQTQVEVEAAPERPPAPDAGREAPDGAVLWHWLGSVGVGLPVRVNKTKKLGQKRTAPVFLDAFGAVVFPTGAVVQHGLGLGVSIGMSEDGGFYEPTPAGSQAALMPAYVAYMPMGADLWVLGHLGVPVLLAGGTSAGLEVAGTLGYRLLAGFGAYTELGISGFAGESSRVNVLASLELGLFVDFEVLP